MVKQRVCFTAEETFDDHHLLLDCKQFRRDLLCQIRASEVAINPDTSVSAFITTLRPPQAWRGHSISPLISQPCTNEADTDCFRGCAIKRLPVEEASGLCYHETPASFLQLTGASSQLLKSSREDSPPTKSCPAQPPLL